MHILHVSLLLSDKKIQTISNADSDIIDIPQAPTQLNSEKEII